MKSDAMALGRKCVLRLMRHGVLPGILAYTVADLAASPIVIDTRVPGPGVGSISYFAPRPVTPEIRFIGDVDGDGRDDIMLRQFSPSGCSDAVLVYGAPASRFEREVAIGDLERVRFPCREGFEFVSMPYCGVGDVDGDGFDDFLLTLARSSWNGVNQSGVVFLVFGAPSYPDEVDLVDPVASRVRHARFVTEVPGHLLGYTSAPAGDLNGDGAPDFAFSSPSVAGTENGGDYAGRVYVVYGAQDLSEEIDAARIGIDVSGFIVHGAYGRAPDRQIPDGLGCCSKGAILPAGDMNGDGRDDLVIMGSEAFDGKGAVYLILGDSSLPSEIFTAQPGGPLVEIRGEQRAYLGFSAGSGDVDADGLQDLVFGAPVGDGTGSSYIIYGRHDWPGTISLNDPALRVFRLDASLSPGDHYPQGGINAAACIGDWDGDGFADLVFGGSTLLVRFGEASGKAYLVFGGSQLPRSASEDDLHSGLLRATSMLGRDAYVRFGDEIEAGGDLDGDGKKDFLVASQYRKTPYPGLPPDKSLIYIFFGGGRAGEQFSAGAILPAEGTTLGGEEVTIIGTAFRGDEEVLFDGVLAQGVALVSTAEIRVRTPPRSIEGPVNVDVRGTGGSATLADAFRYMAYKPIEDIVLDPAWLEARGIRSLIYKSSDIPALGRQAANVFFHDLNGDDLDDLVVGMPRGTADEASRVAVLFGRRDGFPASIQTNEAPDFGFVVDGVLSDGDFGSYVAFPGDLDGDGHEDLALQAFVLFGREKWPRTLRMAEEVENKLAIALPRSSCRTLVAAVGAVEGTGIPALLESQTDQCAGQANLFLDGLETGKGPAEPSVVITGDQDPLTFPWDPESHGPRRFGTELSAAGDLNDDGFPDIIVGAADQFGAFYLILGGAFDFLSASIQELQAAGRAVILHHNEATLSGCGDSATASALGDFNGDGIDDVALGAPEGGRDFHGTVFVVFGSPEFGASIREVSLLTSTAERVLPIVGEFAYDWAGYPEALGDYNQDGIADLGITALSNRSTLPRAYVILGAKDLPERIDLSHMKGRGFRVVGKDGHKYSSRNGGIGAGDLDGDGNLDLAIGAIEYDGSSNPKQVVVIFGGPGATARSFIRGNANGDAIVNITDAVFILGYLFQSGLMPPCLDAADTDDTGELNVTDGVYLLRHLFQGTEAPPAPYPDPGADPTADGLDC